MEEGTAIDSLSLLGVLHTGAGIAALIARIAAASAGLFYWFVLRPGLPEREVARLAPPLALRAAVTSLLLFAFRLPEPWFQLAFLTGQPLGELLGQPGLVAQLIAETRFGRLWLGHQLASLALTSLMALLALRGARSPRLWIVTTAVGLLLPAFAAGSGHTAVHGALPLINHLVHWGAATLWMGGLFHLLATSSFSVTPRLVGTFSPVALIALIAVIFTGVVNGWLYVPDLSYLSRSGYGGWLLIKLALLVGLVALAVYNGLLMAPRLARQPQRLPDFRFSLGLEILFGVGVLVATQRMTQQPPVYSATVDQIGNGRLALELAGPATALGGLILAAGLTLVALGWRRRKPRLGAAGHTPQPPRVLRRALLSIGLGTLLTALGTSLSVSTLLVPRTPWSDHPNPVPLTPEILQLGEELYTSHCTLCHGPQGRGDGFLAPSLPYPPANLAGPYVSARADGDLMWIITHGIEGRDMPPFSFLTETQRWAIVHYLRTLQQQTP